MQFPKSVMQPVYGSGVPLRIARCGHSVLIKLFGNPSEAHAFGFAHPHDGWSELPRKIVRSPLVLPR